MNQQATSGIHSESVQISHIVTGNPLNIGSGFDALSFKHGQFSGLMDPLVMVDHYTMSSPTFGAHPHAGMSALSILFEDSEGTFNNRDSLGNDIDLLPGDAYWLKAGSGAIHDEKPTAGSRTHGLQIFVNLPKQHKHDNATALHVPARDIPVITGAGYRVRVVLGESNDIRGATSPALPFTALDAFLESGGTYAHALSGNTSVTVYAVSGEITIDIAGKQTTLPKKQAVAIHIEQGNQTLHLCSQNQAHVVVLQGAPVREPFVQNGPFVMSSLEEIQQVTAKYESGQLGAIGE
ncbi:pirin-like C-terminal cupin domain-containing protein [Gilvimarinus sp. SDUM040013]|uniref:Pirin-like C-terminal cupin domain-containing protein n=1 Tax=Gilvimarinus gilvus TaxID=3058038 RepID=A0ABU4RYY6_9GAMM|nr:pirin-like C-terminal cupin domain-containing protein [Gilvimarinus sp. SDUM040013]MDO3386871.1 pirin-like C-terminal cupin domain-containing protein [Gilvimarinus sp. SDUM040013]MDX6848199.1 pirin-like C-terminal cupin domain-containing protein [Gilvimarinus sp. SDUM040013]